MSDPDRKCGLADARRTCEDGDRYAVGPEGERNDFVDEVVPADEGPDVER